MKILGIESSCDETAAAVVELQQPTGQQATNTSAMQGADEQRTEPYTKYGEGAAQSATPQGAVSGSGVTGTAGQQAATVCRLLSNVVASSMDLHAQYGGVVPEIAARSHIESIMPVINEALVTAFNSNQSPVISNQPMSATGNGPLVTLSDPWDQIDGIAVTYGAGLGGSLLVGVLAARTLAIIKQKPLYAINHVEAHVYANFLTNTSLPGYTLPAVQPTFPMLAVIVSGGHSQLALFRDHFDYTLLGQTRDDAIGEAFDKVAKILGLPYPGGPSVGKKALEGDPHKYALPTAHLDQKYEFSFSGLKTAVLRLAQNVTGHDHTFPSTALASALSEAQKADIAASFQYTAVKTIVDKAKLAYDEFAPASVVIAGGVAASPELRRQLKDALPRSIEYTDPRLCTDNGAMVATLGCFKASLGQPTADPFTLDIAPNLSM